MRVRPLRRKNAPYVAPTTPAWLSGLDVNEWTLLADTLLSDQPGIDSGADEGKQDAWCGWHIDERTGIIYSVGQGGHDTDYHGNEVDALDPRADAPAWTQLIASSPESAVTPAPTYSAYYSDGKPSSVHGYHANLVIGSINRAMRFWGGATSASGEPMQVFTAFNLLTNEWDVESTWEDTQIPPGTYVGPNSYACAKHPTTEVVYIWAYNSSIFKWEPGIPGTLTELIENPSNPAAAGTAAACDPTRGDEGEIFFLGGGSGGSMCRAYDIATNTFRTITLTGTDISSTRSGFGLVYSQTTDRYYACIPGSGGSSVYVITPTSGSSWACSLLSTTGGGSIPETIGSDNGATYPYTKFLYAPTLGCAFFGPRWSTGVWALKLHEV